MCCKVIVIKLGGSILNPENADKQHSIVQDIAKLKANGFKIVIVHGGSRAVDIAMIKSGIEIKKTADGKRITDKEILQILDQCFSQLNSHIVRLLNEQGVKANGFHGISGGIVKAEREKTGKLGFVGEVKDIDTDKIESIWNLSVPVISPLAFAEDSGQLYNINADDVASEVAIRLSANCFILMTDVFGVTLQDGTIANILTLKEAERLMKNKVITGGMIPKVNACINALKNNVGKAIIMEGQPEFILKAVKNGPCIGTTIITK